MPNTENINDRLGPGGLTEVVVTQTNTTTGATELLGPDGVIPVNRVSTLTLGLSANAALTNGTAIPWDTVVQDDLAIADIITNPTRLPIPDTVQAIRISYTVVYAYNSTPGGTYRGVNPTLKANTATVTKAGLRTMKVPIIPYNAITEADVVFSSGLIDVSTMAASRYLELKVIHDYGTAIPVYGLSAIPCACTIEFYE